VAGARVGFLSEFRERDSSDSRLVGMQHSAGLVLIAAAFAIIASVTLFGKAERAPSATTMVTSKN
jgi:hypothetical protein